MASISERERVLLGYASRDPFGGAVSRSQRQNSDVEFLDVFGGPPRRSSLYESQRSRGESMDSHSRLSRGREDSLGSHLSRFGSGEKPAFGDGGSSGRRQQLGDDFYGDIFQVSESSCSSPISGNRDHVISSPSSRVSSPSRLTPPSLEPLLGGSSLRNQPSLTETMSKGLDHPSLGSPVNHPVNRSEDGGSDAFSYSLSSNASSLGFSTTQPVVGYGDLKNNNYGSYRQSPLSRTIPSGFDGFSEATKLTSQTVEHNNRNTSRSLEDYVNNKQFHFSIYKWAGKGIMLVLPSDSNEGNELEGLTKLPEIVVQELELDTNFDNFSPVIKSPKSGLIIQENKTDKKADDYAGTIAGSPRAKSGLDPLKDKYGNQSDKDSIPEFDKNSMTNSTDGEQNLEFLFSAHNEQSPELKSLSEQFDDGTKKPRNHDIHRQVKEREAQSKNQKKQQLRSESKQFNKEDNSANLHDVPSFSEDKHRGSKVKAKVKEFMKKLNQQLSPKRKGAFEMLNLCSKAEENRHDKVNELTHISFIELDNLQGGTGNKSMPLFDTPEMMENILFEKVEEGKPSISYNGHIIDDCHSEEKVEVLHSQPEPAPEDFKNASFYEEIIHDDMEEYLVRQLPINQTEGALINSQQDQIKNLDISIRQWSKGKEGNIRSLLSTLQLVLWPESGWKQVPLVDIIEGPSVKKAYQKALLCLHPDKLQQKGASSNQKYMAEKIFDILQEAWDHFNSVSQF